MKVLHINCNYIYSALHGRLTERLESPEVHNLVFVPVTAANAANATVAAPGENVTVSECFRKIDRYFFDRKQSKICRAARRSLDLTGVDCIHAHTVFTDGNCARTLARELGVPYIVAVRNTDVNAFFKKRALLRGRGIAILRGAERIIFLSESYRNTVFAQYVPVRFREELLAKSVVIPNGIDDFWLANRNWMGQQLPAQGPVRLIYAGRIDRNKNIPLIQQAMDLLRREGLATELTVVGRIQDRAEFERIRQDRYTTYHEPVDKEQLIHIYRENHIFVMPSHTETFGLVYAEAMSQGLPVIYTRGQGFDGQFADGTVGYATSDRDAAQLAGCIRQVLADYKELSENARQRVDKFDWGKIAEQYRQIYCSITDDGK